jgi:hypothetical protein
VRGHFDVDAIGDVEAVCVDHDHAQAHADGAQGDHAGRGQDHRRENRQQNPDRAPDNLAAADNYTSTADEHAGIGRVQVVR